jgi:glutaminyl-peptide cyclotransferase
VARSVVCLLQVHVDNGTVIRAIDLPAKSFGEGLTRTRAGGLMQLTWRTGVTFEYPAVDTFHTGNFSLAAAAADSTKGGCSAPDASCEPALAQGVVQRHTGLTDGWGIASDGAGNLIVTDSTETMYWLDEVTLETKRREVVTFEGAPLQWVNELEWIEGEVSSGPCNSALLSYVYAGYTPCNTTTSHGRETAFHEIVS